MKLVIVVIGFLIASAFAMPPDVQAQACGGWWDPCCDQYDKSKWDLSCYPEWERRQMEEQQVQPITHRGVEQSDKDYYAKSAEGFKAGRNYFLAIAATAALFEKDEVQEVIVKGAQVAAVLALWAQLYFEALAKDPWDDNYAYPYDAPWPSAEELGLTYLSDNSAAEGFINVLVSATRELYRTGDGAYTSINRSGTCEQVEGSNCAQQRADEAYAYIVAMSSPMYVAAYGLSGLRDIFLYEGASYDFYSPECDCSLTGALDQSAWDFWYAAEYLATR
jgi:hypothetical protein